MSTSINKYNVFERTSGLLTFSLKRVDGSALPASAIETATLRLTTAGGRLLIDSVNCLNANNVTISSQGLVTWAITPSDTRWIGDASVEMRSARFKFVWDSGASGLEHFVQFEIKRA